MKRTIFLAMIFTLLAVGMVFASSPFKPLSIQGYTISLPEGAVVPDRSVLRLTETRINPFDSRVIMYLYQSPEKVYVDERGEVVYPYMEMTVKADDGSIHLLAVSFVSEGLTIEMYENKAAFGDSHQDELMRTTGHFKERKVREFKR